MTRKSIAGAIVALTVLLFTSVLQAQASRGKPNDLSFLEQLSDAAYAAEDWNQFREANRRLNELRPYEPEYMYRLVLANALLGDRSAAYNMMVSMQRQGISYDFNLTEDSESIRNSELYTFINNMMTEAGKPLGKAETTFVLQGDPADFRSITWDASRARFLVGTLKEGKILAVTEDGATELLMAANDENGLWSINGLAADTERNRLWVSSAATPAFGAFIPTDKNRGALFEFDLETLEMRGRYNLPVDAYPHELGSIAMTEDGHVYVIDRAVPIIYRKTPDGDRLEAYIGSQDLVALTDITVTPEHSRIFASDRARGIFVVDPVAQEFSMLKGPELLNLGGIEGIEYADGQLIVVQGGMKPQRVMRLALEPSGAVVGQVGAMAVAQPEYDQPGLGTLRDQDLFYFANPGSESDAPGAIVMRTALDAGDAITNPTIEDLQNALKRRKTQ